MTLAEPRSGPTPKRRSSNATSTSRTDPDAKPRYKPGQRPHLVYRGQIAGVDPKARCVVACLGETADGHEGDALAPIIQRARFACPELESVGADQGFAGEQVWKDVAALGVTAFVPPQRTMLPAAGQQPTTDAKREARAACPRRKTPPGSGRTSGACVTPRALSPSSSTSTAWIAPAVAAPACSTSNCCSAAPP